MSKTLTGILQTVVGVGLEFVPGAQAIGTSLIISGVTSTVTSLLSSTPKPEQTETEIKTPIPPRVSGYGRVRLYMAYTLYVTASDGTAVDVGAIHDGQIDGIERYYLGDTQVTIDANGYVQTGDAGQFGDNSDNVRIFTRLGLPTETAFAEVIAKVPDQWTVNHRGDGVCTGAVLSKAVKAANYQKIYPTGGPNQMPLSLAMRLQLVFDWRDPSQSVADPTTWKWSENVILHLAHYLLVRDAKDWATHFLPTLAYWTAAANDCDVAMPLNSVQAISVEKADKGSSHLTLSTVNGLSDGTTITIAATGNTSLTETRTVTSIDGMVVTLSSPLTNDHPRGSQVTWGGTNATEPRYRSCLVHKHTDAHKDVISGLLACCDGWMAPRSDGAMVVYSGRYTAPTVSIGPDEIVSYSLQDGVDEENAINQIAVTYISANHDFNTVDTDAWEDADDIDTRGKVLADKLDNQVPSFSQARRLAKRSMAKTNAPKRGTITTNAAGRIVRGQRYIMLDLTDAGTTFYAGPAEITKLTRNVATGGVTFDWIAADPNIDAWNPATEEGQPAPVGNRIAPSPLATPTIISATPVRSAVGQNPDQDTALGGTEPGGVSTGVRVLIAANGPIRDDLTWSARWRVGTTGAWSEREYPDADPGPGVSMTTEFVPLVNNLNVEVAYRAGDGVLSDWSDPTVVDTTYHS